MTLQEEAEEYASQFKTQASSEGLENIKSDFIAGAQAMQKRLIKRFTELQEGISDVKDVVYLDGVIAVIESAYKNESTGNI